MRGHTAHRGQPAGCLSLDESLEREMNQGRFPLDAGRFTRPADQLVVQV